MDEARGDGAGDTYQSFAGEGSIGQIQINSTQLLLMIAKLFPNLTIAGIRAGFLYISYCCFVLAIILKVSKK
jgi:hypothetical protein